MNLDKVTLCQQLHVVKPEETKQGGYVFSEKNGVVVMEAEHFSKVKQMKKQNGQSFPILAERFQESL